MLAEDGLACVDSKDVGVSTQGRCLGVDGGMVLACLLA